ncbi:hypothetical protein QTP88_023827 [Uroleucon formosanum]
MEKRKLQSGASKRSAKIRNDLIACEDQINTDVQADGPYIDEENKSVSNTALSPEVIEEITLFVPPNINASASDKLCFLRYHPIQPSSERSFSKLKIIKTRLRSLIGQDLLESLILINSEADISKWNYNDIT